MNWLLIAVVALIGFHIYDGIHRGFIRKTVSMASFLVTLLLVTWLSPLVADFLIDQTPFYDDLKQKCTEVFYSDDFDETEKSGQVLAIEGMELPQSIKEMLLENNNHEVYDMLQVADFYEYVGAYLARMILNTMAYLLTFVLVWTALKIAVVAMDLVAKLPLLHGVNKLAGAGIGAAEGIAFVWVAFLLVTVFSSGEFGQRFFEMIRESELLLFLYENNLIMKLVYGMIL